MLLNNSNNLNTSDISKYKFGTSYYFNSIENDFSYIHYNDVSSITGDSNYTNKYLDKKLINNLNDYLLNSDSTNFSNSNNKIINNSYNSFNLNNNQLESKDLYKKYLGITKYYKETDDPIMINDENFLSKTKKIIDSSKLRDINEKEEKNKNTIIINNNIHINAFIDKKNDFMNYYKNRLEHINNKYNNSKYFMKKNTENYGLYHDINNKKSIKLKDEFYKSTDNKSLKLKNKENIESGIGDIKTYYSYGNCYSNLNNISKYTENSNLNDSKYKNDNYERFRYLKKWKKIENEVGKSKDISKKINNYKKHGRLRDFYNF